MKNLEQKAVEMAAHLRKLNEPVAYWAEYNKYKLKFEKHYEMFFKCKKQAFSFEEAFGKAFNEIIPPRGEAQIHAFNNIEKKLKY